VLRELSNAERGQLLSITARVADSTARTRPTYDFADHISRYPAEERDRVVETLRAGGYPVATDSAYWHSFDRALQDVRSGTYRYELVENLWVVNGGPMVSELRDAVLAERYGVVGDVVAGHVCVQRPGGPTCVVQQAGRAGYNRAMNLTVGRLFGTDDLIRRATEEGMNRYAGCKLTAA